MSPTLRMSEAELSRVLAGAQRHEARKVAVRPPELDPFVLSQVDLSLHVRRNHVKVATFPVEPMGAPRINGAAGRYSPAAKRYYAWREQFALAWRAQRYMGKPISARVLRQLPCVLAFTFPLAVSLTKAEVASRAGWPHDHKPDVDNCVKAVLDTMLPEGDSGTWDIRGIKRWAAHPDHRGSITLYVGPEFV